MKRKIYLGEILCSEEDKIW